MSSPSVEDLRAILAAYKRVVDATWPDLHPTMRERSRRWATASAQELATELAALLKESSAGGSASRVFWKIAPRFEFGGANRHFATDAGFADPAELVGLTDSDPRLPWRPQAAKYRADDEAVVTSKTAQLGIIERQKGPTGEITWVRVAKVPIVHANGDAVGVLGVYEPLDPDIARKLAVQQLKRSPT
ncbi:MAG: PAS domain-containing protein [bacterium]